MSQQLSPTIDIPLSKTDEYDYLQWKSHEIPLNHHKSLALGHVYLVVHPTNRKSVSSPQLFTWTLPPTYPITDN